ncbi:MAG TPA: hypothetical protein VF516_34785 [Kofleriaceae bacterium]
MIDIRNQVGRLIEVTIESPTTTSEWKAIPGQLTPIHGRLPGKYMYCANISRARLLRPEEVEPMKKIMQLDNPRLLRTALYLGSNSATLMLQMERLIRETSNPERKTFRDPQKLIAWMSEVTTAEEQERISELYGNLSS